MRGRIASLVVVFAVACSVAVAASSAGDGHPAASHAPVPHWVPVGDLMIVDVPAGFGKYPDLDPFRAGTQVVVQVLYDTVGRTIRFATAFGADIAAGPDGGVTPFGTIAAGGRAFLLGAARGGPTRVWTPAFDAAHSLASVDPQLGCGQATASAPLAGPFTAVIPRGAQPGGHTVASPAVAFVFGNPADLKRGVRITTREGVDLGRTTDGTNVALGGFGFAGAVFAYGTARGAPVLWTPALVDRSSDLVRSGFVSCTAVAPPPPPLQIASIAPASGTRGTSVTVSGSGFGGAGLKVAVGGVAATVGAATDVSATFTVPAGAPLGPTTVQLTNAGGQSGSIAFTVQFDGNVTTVLDPAHAATAAIGPQGGSITASGSTLTVPPGALQETQTITVTPLTSLGGVDVAQLYGGVQLEPQGLHFLVPASLTIALPSGASPAGIFGFGFDGAGTSLHLVPATVSGGTVVLPISHFSGAGAARLTPAQSTAVVGYLPSPADELAEQQISAALALAAQNGTDPSAAIDAALSTWYRTSVRVGLQVVGATTEFYELAVGEWQAWHGVAQSLGRDQAHVAENTEAQGLATTDAAHLADLALAACNGSSIDLPTLLTPLVRLASDLQTVPLDIETKQTADGKQLPSALHLVRACVQVKIDNVARPSAFALDPDANTITVDLHVAFWTGATRRDVPVDIDVRDATAGEPVRVGSDTTTSGHSQIVDTSAKPVGTASLRVTGNLPEDEEGIDEVDFTVPVRKRIDFSPDITVAPGDQANLTVLLAGDGMANAAVTYALAGSGSLAATSGTTDANGKATVAYTASSDPAGGTDVVTAGFGPVATARLKITVKPTISVSVAPTSVTVQTGATAQFAATVTNGTKGVTWSAGGGSIDQHGLYTAGTTAGTFTVTATSVDDPSKSATASVTVRAEALPTITWDGTFADGSAGGGFSGADTDGNWFDPAVDNPEVNDPSGGNTFSGGTSATCPDPGGGPATNSGSAQYDFSAGPDFVPFTPIDPPGTGAAIDVSGAVDVSASSPSCSAFAGGQTTVKIGFEVSGGSVQAHVSLSAAVTGDLFDGPNFADVSATLSGQFGALTAIRIQSESRPDGGVADLTLGPGFYRVELDVHAQANAFDSDASNTIHADGRIGVTLTP